MPHRRPPAAALHDSSDDVEAQFYEALQQADLQRLMAVWADDEEIVCVHPGGERAVGPAAIGASFEAVFANGGIAVVPEQVHRVQTVGAAVHHLVERITVQTPKGARTAWVMATNVYLKTALGWRLVAHHASVAPEQPMPAANDAPSTLH